jgi:hypothetical protein
VFGGVGMGSAHARESRLVSNGARQA